MVKFEGNYDRKEYALLTAQTTTRRVYDFCTNKGIEFKEIKT